MRVYLKNLFKHSIRILEIFLELFYLLTTDNREFTVQCFNNTNVHEN